jgi:hypothetical protein
MINIYLNLIYLFKLNKFDIFIFIFNIYKIRNFIKKFKGYQG